MRKLSTRTPSVVAVVVAVALAPSASVAQRGPMDEDASSANGEDCPEPLRGSTLSAKDVSSGIALEFETATRAQVDGLRAHLRELAALLEQETGGAGKAGPTMPVLQTSVSNTVTGARLTLRTPSARDVPELRAAGRELEQAWPSSPCSAGMSMPASGEISLQR